MQNRATDSKGPGVGSASLQFYDAKFHHDMLKTAKSRVGGQFHDRNHFKRRQDLSYFKKDHGTHALKQIDKKNLQMFIRLSSVQPSVPVVVKRSTVQQVELTQIQDVSETNERVSQLPKVMVNSNSQQTNLRSQSVPRHIQKQFNINLNSASQPMGSPGNTYRSSKDILGQDGAVLVELATKGTYHNPVQSVASLPANLGQPDSSTNLNPQESQRTMKTTTQWYLKSPAKNAFFDQAYKVVPTLNHAQRVNRLDKITKENQKLFERLQGVRSDYDATKLLRQTNTLQSHKSRLSSFTGQGMKKRDPLMEKHILQETLSKKRLSTLRSSTMEKSSP